MLVSNSKTSITKTNNRKTVDIILMEFKLPQINGEDVARMIRTSRNPNSNTPIVAVTGYLKDLNDPHHFTELIEKPATMPKLTDVLQRNCHWKPADPERAGASDRQPSYTINKPPPATHEDSGRISPTVERFMGGGRRGRMSEQFSSMDEDDAVSVASTSDPVLISRSTTNEWEGLHVGKPSNLGYEVASPPALTSVPMHSHETAPSRLQSHVIERMPSPLSTHVSAVNAVSTLNSMSQSLALPPELAPLPPSLTSAPVFSNKTSIPSRSPSRSPFSRTPPPPTVTPPLQTPTERFKSLIPKRSPPRQSRTPSEDGGRKSPSKRSSSVNSSPTKGNSPTLMPSSPESKTKSKRSSFEKKKEKQEKQQRQGLRVEDADADDELSAAGGKKPSKSKSIGEMMISRVRKSPPEMKRSKSDIGEGSDI